MTSLLFQDSASQYWAVSVDDLGVLHGDSAAPGSLSAGFINDAGGTTSWQIVVSTTGDVTAGPVTFNGSYPTAIPLVSPGSITWNIVVSSVGDLVTTAAAGTVYNAGTTLTVTVGEASGVWAARQGAASFAVTTGMPTASQANVTKTATLAVTAGLIDASTANLFKAVPALAVTFSLQDVGGGDYVVTTGAMGVTMAESSSAWTARQGALTLPVTMGQQSASVGTVTSSASLSVHPAATTLGTADRFSATTLAVGTGISTLSALASASYDKATSLAFTATLAAPQPKLDGAGRASLSVALSETAASRADYRVGTTLPVVPGLTAATALPVSATATLASHFGLISDGITNLATVIAKAQLDAIKSGAPLKAEKETTDLAACDDAAHLGGEV